MRNAIAGLALASAVSLVPTAARADTPIVIGPVTDEGVVAVFDCPGFQVLNHYVTTFVARQMVDKKGNVIRLVGQTWGVDTFVNAATGREIESRYHNNANIDLRTNVGSMSGVITNINVPGLGSVFKDVGHLVVNDAGAIIFRSGTHQWIDGDFAGICAALE